MYRQQQKHQKTHILCVILHLDICKRVVLIHTAVSYNNDSDSCNSNSNTNSTNNNGRKEEEQKSPSKKTPQMDVRNFISNR